MFTRKNPNVPQQLMLDNFESMNISNFDAKKSTKFMTHGWLGNYLKRSCILVKDGKKNILLFYLFSVNALLHNKLNF